MKTHFKSLSCRIANGNPFINNNSDLFGQYNNNNERPKGVCQQHWNQLSNFIKTFRLNYYFLLELASPYIFGPTTSRTRQWRDQLSWIIKQEEYFNYLLFCIIWVQTHQPPKYLFNFHANCFPKPTCGQLKTLLRRNCQSLFRHFNKCNLNSLTLTVCVYVFV